MVEIITCYTNCGKDIDLLYSTVQFNYNYSNMNWIEMQGGGGSASKKFEFQFYCIFG